jgi:hypothetical protein
MELDQDLVGWPIYLPEVLGHSSYVIKCCRLILNTLNNDSEAIIFLKMIQYGQNR